MRRVEIGATCWRPRRRKSNESSYCVCCTATGRACNGKTPVGSESIAVSFGSLHCATTVGKNEPPGLTRRCEPHRRVKPGGSSGIVIAGPRHVLPRTLASLDFHYRQLQYHPHADPT